MTALFVLCAGLIPAVPLIGVEIFKRRGDVPRRNACYVLFAMQLMLSAAYISAWLAR